MRTSQKHRNREPIFHNGRVALNGISKYQPFGSRDYQDQCYWDEPEPWLDPYEWEDFGRARTGCGSPNQISIGGWNLCSPRHMAAKGAMDFGLPTAEDMRWMEIDDRRTVWETSAYYVAKGQVQHCKMKPQIVVQNYARAGYWPQFIKTLRNQTIPFDLVIIDCAPPDKPQLPEKLCKQAEYYYKVKDKPYGPFNRYAIMAKHPIADYTLFIDDDFEVQPQKNVSGCD